MALLEIAKNPTNIHDGNKDKLERSKLLESID